MTDSREPDGARSLDRESDLDSTEDKDPPCDVIVPQTMYSTLNVESDTPSAWGWPLASKSQQVVRVSCTAFCVGKMLVLVDGAALGNPATRSGTPFRVMEIFCIAYFTMNFRIWCTCSPQPRRLFFKCFLNPVELLGMVPLHMHNCVLGNDGS